MGCSLSGAWWDHLPACCLLPLLLVALVGGSPSGGVQMDSGYAKQDLLPQDPLRILLTKPLSFLFHPRFVSKGSGT